MTKATIYVPSNLDIKKTSGVRKSSVYVFQTFLIIFLAFLYTINLNAQQTIGLIQIEENTSEGYTFFCPMAYTEFFLIDNCGKKIHSWNTGARPSYSGFLLEDGSVIFSQRITSQFDPEFPSGILKRFDWEGNLIWEFNDYVEGLYYHHDFAVLQNGNILVVTDQYLSAEDAINAGRNPELIEDYTVGLVIVEYEPLPDSGAVEVWRWEVFDHLIQDFDPTKDNFGTVNDEIGKIDINYITAGSLLSLNDWNHTNSIQHHPGFDQIIVSNRNQSEIWVIDHSTTTEEAATDSGGNSGKGGEILYRWGNPEVYDRGSTSDRKLFSQHDAQWILPPLENSGNILTFNNNYISGLNSQVLEIQLSYDSPGVYEDPDTEAYGPEEPSWSYVEEDFYSPNISGLQRLANGNTLICEGDDGRLFEITSEGEIVWEYINPVNVFGPMAQFNEPNSNSVFQAIKYPLDYAAFEGRDLTPGDPLELDFIEIECPLIIDPKDTVSVGELQFDSYFSAQYIPSLNTLDISTDIPGGELSIYNSTGKIILQKNINDRRRAISLGQWSSGVYIAGYSNGNAFYSTKFIIQ